MKKYNNPVVSVRFRMKILIVDDHEDNLYLLQTLLSGNGYQVISAPHGARAFEILEAEKIDLVITDILMPVMDGFQLCRKIKTHPTLKSIPLIFYTATYTGEKDESFALKIGAERFLVKPCDPDTFMTAVTEVLDEARENHGATAGPEIESDEAYKLYSERLVTKLEHKMLEAEQEIVARKAAETELRKSRERLIEAQRLAGMGDFTWDVATGEVTWSDALFDLLGYDPGEPLGIDRIKAEIHHPDDADDVAAWLQESIDSNRKNLSPREYRVIRKDGQVLNIRTVGRIEKNADKNPLVFATIQDITAGKQAEVEKEKLQDQLNQAQKLESIGRLAGGVAHDYNNMLSVIMGFAELALGKIPPESSLHNDLEEILTAARRSSDMTRKLLTFARKQEISPRLLNLNDVIEGMLKMLGRVIGERIHFSRHLDPGLWDVFVDPSQVDQILVNLCVNAKDAIDGSGSTHIETANVQLDDRFCTDLPGAVPGDFVALTVTDDGCGMDSQTQEKIFEPFFTTKASDKGTGLGLATVYGIVNQNNGFIHVTSEPHKGTSFTIYLPRHLSPGS
jgi:PAS domain S-box-containing protein